MVKRDDVAAAALRLLNSDPTASMNEIAQAAGISRATLHRHFANREELIQRLGQWSIDSWRDALDSAEVDTAVESGDPVLLRRTLEALCRHLVRDAEEHGFALTEPSLEDDEEIMAAARELEARERAFYAAAQRAEVLRSDLPVAWIAGTMFGLLVGLRETLRHGEIAPVDAERLLRTTMLYGTGAGPHVKEEGP